MNKGEPDDIWWCKINYIYSWPLQLAQKKIAGYVGTGEGVTWILLSLPHNLIVAPEARYSIQIAEWVKMLVTDKDWDFPGCWMGELWYLLETHLHDWWMGWKRGFYSLIPQQTKGQSTSKGSWVILNKRKHHEEATEITNTEGSKSDILYRWPRWLES